MKCLPMLRIVFLPFVLDADHVIGTSGDACMHTPAGGRMCPRNGESMMQRLAPTKAGAGDMVVAAARAKDETIPRIIHMTYDDIGKNPKWSLARASWISNNPDWELMEWTPEKNREFVNKQYPWFLSTYDGFDKDIKRFDAMRYLYLHHFGGVYTDMDVTATKPVGTFTSDTGMIFVGSGGLLNNFFMASVPDASIWLEVLHRITSVEQLPKDLFADGMTDDDRADYEPFDNVFCSTGLYMFSSVWEKAFNGSMHGVGSVHGLKYRIYTDEEATAIMGMSHEFEATWDTGRQFYTMPMAPRRSHSKEKGISECEKVQPGWQKIVFAPRAS